MCAFNICSVENGTRIYKRSSESNSRYAPASNVLSSQRSLVWTSEDGLPQFIILDLRHLIKRPKQIRHIGFDFWHDYDSNPKIVQVQIKQSTIGDDEDFITWRSLKLECRVGVQYFDLDPIPSRFDLIKILIKETYGASQTYMNQIMLYATNPATQSMHSVKTSGEESQWRRDEGSRFRSMDLREEDGDGRLEQEDSEEDQSKEHQYGEEEEVRQDSLSGIVHSRRHQSHQSRQYLNNFEVLETNMLSIKDSLQQMCRRMETMAIRLERSQRNQQDMESRIISHMEKYIDKRLQSKAEKSVQRKDVQLHQLFKLLHQKLLLKEKKLDRLTKQKK